MRRLLAALALATAAHGAMPAYAQQAEQPAVQQDDQSALEALTATELSPERMALALQVVRLSGTSRTFDEFLPNIAESAKQSFIRANPQMQLGIIGIVDRVARDLVARRAKLDEDLAKIWGAAFTDEELQAFVDFYSTDAGKKLAGVHTRLLAVQMATAEGWGRAISRELTEKVSAELKASLAAEQNSLEGTQPAAAPAQ